METASKNFSLEDNYYDAFQFSDLSQTGIESENNGNFLNNVIDYPTIILEPDDTNISSTLIPQRLQQANTFTPYNQLYDETFKDDRDYDDNQNLNKIKFEPIKSELNELNALNVLNSTNNNKNRILEDNKNVKNSETHNNANHPICYKCECCPFISISEDNLIKHKENIHTNKNKIIQNDDNEIKCPGCDNIHYTRRSLEIHLEIDHQMHKNEISILLNAFCKDKSNSVTNTVNEPKKSRIYLKNVEVLKNPQPIENLVNQIDNDIQNVSLTEDLIYELSDHDQTLDNNLTFIDLVGDCSDNNNNSNVKKISPQKNQQMNKISIKSVDVLREPSLVNHQNYDYQQQQNNSSKNLITDKMYYDLDIGFTNNFQENFIQSLSSSPSSNENTVCSVQNEEKPRRAKIYIKNVDILKEPIFVPPPNNLSNILNMNDDLRLNLLNAEHQLSEPSFISPVTILPPQQSQLPHPSPITPQILPQSLSSSSPSIVFDLDSDSPQFSLNSENLQLPTSNKDIVADNSHRGKIHIKSVDIINQPCTSAGSAQSSSSSSNLPSIQEFPKRFITSLHLRTVDELNLMNTNEVQNLITPILDQNVEHGNRNYQNEGDSNELLENSKNLTEDSAITTELDYTQSQNLNYDDIPTLWSADNELNDNRNKLNNNGLDIDSNSSLVSNDQKNTMMSTMINFDLNTPQRPEIIDDDDDCYNNNGDSNQSQIENNPVQEEEDILFVCTQEIVNQEGTQNEHRNESFIDDEQEIIEILDDLEKQKIFDGIDNNVQIEENVENCQQIQKEEKQKAKRGRPYGSKQTGITKMRKLYGISLSEAEFYKCDMNCALRFKKSETLEIHKKCHVSASSQQKQCPECNLIDFSSWNTLHTHLWRCHKIDMELYSCDMCDFKTPIQSLLVNTHRKIHFDEKNFKCEQCGKLFKNKKQLKNHRRLHRKNAEKEQTEGKIVQNIEVHKCDECGATYAHMQSLKDHICKDKNYSCSTCGKVITSKSAFKSHILTHKDDSVKRFTCDDCNYTTNDHNAFRRHRMTHNRKAKYQCKFCEYKCIQSNLYQRHLLQKHPDNANEVLFKCSVCSFTTINQTNYKVHIAKHENSTILTNQQNQPQQQESQQQSQQITSFDLESDIEIIPNCEENPIQFIQNNVKNIQNGISSNKIKVKSDLVLTDPTKIFFKWDN